MAFIHDVKARFDTYDLPRRILRSKTKRGEGNLSKKRKSVMPNQSKPDRKAHTCRSHYIVSRLEGNETDTGAGRRNPDSYLPSTKQQNVDADPYINPISGQWVFPITASSAGPSRRSQKSEEAMEAQLIRSKAIIETCNTELLLESNNEKLDQRVMTQVRGNLATRKIQPSILHGKQRKRQFISSLGSTTCSRLKRFASRCWSVQKLSDVRHSQGRIKLSWSLPRFGKSSSFNGSTTPETQVPRDPCCSSRNKTNFRISSDHIGKIIPRKWTILETERRKDPGAGLSWNSADIKLSATWTAPSQARFSSLNNKHAVVFEVSAHNKDEDVTSCAYDHIFALSLAEKTPQDVGRFLEAQHNLRVSLQKDWQIAKQLSDQYNNIDVVMSRDSQRKPSFEDAKQNLAQRLPLKRIFASPEEWQNPTSEQLDILRLQAEWSKPDDQNTSTGQIGARTLQSSSVPVGLEKYTKASQGKSSDAKRLINTLEWQTSQENFTERQARAARTEKAKRRKLVPCVACSELRDDLSLKVLKCGHAYDTNCLIQAISVNLRDRKLFTCCKGVVAEASIQNLLDGPTRTAYQLLLLEKQTPHPIYCAKPNCGKFVPPSNVSGDKATCSTCSSNTCRLCRALEHPGVCTQDNNGKKLLNLAKSQKWATCPNCNAVVDKIEGCLHITCRCSFEFCYNCVREWKVCKSTCSRGS